MWPLVAGQILQFISGAAIIWLAVGFWSAQLDGCIAWVPLVLVGFDADLGVDLVRQAPGAVGVLVLSGALGVVAWWGILKWLRRPRRAGLARAMDEGSAGPHLRRALAELGELARFEQA